MEFHGLLPMSDLKNLNTRSLWSHVESREFLSLFDDDGSADEFSENGVVRDDRLIIDRIKVF